MNIGFRNFLGEKQKAYHYLEVVAKQNFVPVFIPQLFKDDPMFDSIRGEERFKKIQRELEEKNQKERDRVTKWLQTESLKTKLGPKM